MSYNVCWRTLSGDGVEETSSGGDHILRHHLESPTLGNGEYVFTAVWHLPNAKTGRQQPLITISHFF